MRDHILLCAALVLAGCGGSQYAGGSPAGTGAGHVQQARSRSVEKAQAASGLVIAWDHFEPAIKADLEAAAQPGDYINLTIAQQDPALLARVGGWSHVFYDPTSTSTPSPGTTPAPGTIANAVAMCPGPGTIFYDIEHWSATPTAQQQDPVGSILTAMGQISAASPCGGDGYTTFGAGIAPDGVFSGWYSCGSDFTSSQAFYNHKSWAPSDWQQVGFYDLQIQTLLSQSPWDVCYGSLAAWWNVVGYMTSLTEANNPSIQVWAHVSLGDESPQLMAQAVLYAASQPNAPAAYTVLYPDNATVPCPDPNVSPTPAPHSWTTRCTFDSPANLATFAALIGRPTPPPSPTPSPTSTPSPVPSATPTSTPALPAIATVQMGNGSAPAGTSIACVYPQPPAPGDVLLAGVEVAGNVTFSAPSGWTLIDQTATANDSLATFWRDAGPSEPVTTAAFAYATSLPSTVTCGEWSNVAAGAAGIDVHAITATAGVSALPSLTPAEIGDQGVGWFVVRNGSSKWSNLNAQWTLSTAAAGGTATTGSNQLTQLKSLTTSTTREYGGSYSNSAGTTQLDAQVMLTNQ